MSTSYVNGYNHPSFIIRKEGNTYLETIDLPITNESGLVEEYMPEEQTVKLLNKTLRQKFLGWRPTFTLYYDKYVTADTMLKIAKLVDYSKGVSGYGNCNIQFIPRVDNPARQFKVLLTNDSIALGILKGGAKSPGMRMPVLKFESISLVKKLPISNIDAIPLISADVTII